MSAATCSPRAQCIVCQHLWPARWKAGALGFIPLQPHIFVSSLPFSHDKDSPIAPVTGGVLCQKTFHECNALTGHRGRYQKVLADIFNDLFFFWPLPQPQSSVYLRTEATAATFLQQSENRTRRIQSREDDLPGVSSRLWHDEYLE